MKPVRNSIKAIIINEGRVLCTVNEDSSGVFYLLPGGGQEPGETMVEALKRECLEEISAEVEVGEIMLIREYIGKNHEFAKWDFDVHQVEYMFECVLKPGAKPRSGHVPDGMQTGVEWVDIGKFSEYRFYPAELKKYITVDGVTKGKIYLGDVG